MRFVISVYGETYIPLLAVCLDSLDREHPRDRVTVVWDQINDIEIKLLQTRFPAVDFQKQGKNILHKDLRKRIPLKLRFWADILNYVKEDVICFLDSDTLVYKNITPYTQQDFDLLFTWKNETFPLNIGVVIIKNSWKIRKLMELWLRRIEDIVSDEEQLKLACALHGAADQQALADLIGTTDYANEITRTFKFGCIRFKGVPCEELNQSNIVPVGNSVSIFHYKTGWHPILLREEGFTFNRPKKIALDLLYLWEKRYSAHNNCVMNEFVINAVSRHRDIIKRGEFECRKSGELPSEMLAVLASIKELDIEIVIEIENRCLDNKTILAEGFKDGNVIIFYISLKNDKATISDKTFFNKYPNVHFRFGDSLCITEEIVKKHKSKRVAILFNEPEGKNAYDFFSKIIAEHKNVKAGFFRNCCPSAPNEVNLLRREIYKYYDRWFFTDNDEYLRKFMTLDQYCKEHEQLVPSKGWYPYRTGCDSISNYGRTIAIVIPTERDKERWKKISKFFARDNRKRNCILKFLSSIRTNIKEVLNIC